MAIDATLEKLLDDAGITGDDRQKAIDAFSVESLGNAIKNGVMRQSDYSRNMDAWSAQKKTYETNWAKANTEYNAMLADLASTQAEKAAAATKLKEAEDKLATTQLIDPAKYISVDAYKSDMQKFAAGQTAFIGDVLEITDEHRDLFGTKLNPNQLMKEALAAQKTPKEYWTEKYAVPAKREEVAKTADDARIAAIKAEAKKEALAEYSNPSSRPLRDSDRPFYESSDGDTTKNPWDDNGPTEQEKNLVSALQEAGR